MGLFFKMSCTRLVKDYLISISVISLIATNQKLRPFDFMHKIGIIYFLRRFSILRIGTEWGVTIELRHAD